jgi:hypothetical protein
MKSELKLDDFVIKSEYIGAIRLVDIKVNPDKTYTEIYLNEDDKMITQTFPLEEE